MAAASERLLEPGPPGAARAPVWSTGAVAGRTETRVLIRVLGPLDILAGERRRTLGSPRQRQLLAQLVVHAGHVVAVDALVDGLWGGAPPRTAAHTVQGLVSRLRTALGPGAIVARPPGYVLVLDEVDLDREHFERVVARARALAGSGDAEQAVQTFDAALGWWRGRAYEEVADCPFARGDATRLEEVRAAVIEDRADVLLGSGPASELIGDLKEAARDEPYRERRQGQLMVALARAGRPMEAMRSYEQFRRRLADEVGVVPSRSLQALNDDILRQAPGTEWRYPGPGTPAPPPPTPTRLPRPVTSLVGRADEIATLVDALQAPGLVTICGPGGVGKTRLAVEVAHRARDGGRVRATACGGAICRPSPRSTTAPARGWTTRSPRCWACRPHPTRRCGTGSSASWRPGTSRW